MRNLLATTAIAAMMSLPAAAQQSTDSTQSDQTMSNSATGQQQQSMSDPQLQNRGVTINASNLMQHPVHIKSEGSASQEELPTELADAPDTWEDAGEIEDIIMTREGQPNSVVLKTGQALGESDKQIEVSFADLSLVRDSDDEGEFFVVYTGDRSKLEEAKEYDTAARMERGDQSYKEQSGSTESAQASGAAAGGAQSEDSTESAEMQTGDDATEQAQSDTETQMQSAEAEEEGVVLNEGGSTQEADAGMSDDQTEPAQTAESGTLITEGEATDQEAQPEMTEEQTLTEESDVAATDQADTPTSEGGLVESEMDYLAQTERDALTAEDMEGLSVYGAGGEDIGEISELLIAEDGKIDNVVIDVGGFLGIGEKHVSVPFDELKLSRGDGGLMNDLRVDVNFSQEELESMQPWEK